MLLELEGFEDASLDFASSKSEEGLHSSASAFFLY